MQDFLDIFRIFSVNMYVSKEEWDHCEQKFAKLLKISLSNPEPYRSIYQNSREWFNTDTYRQHIFSIVTKMSKQDPDPLLMGLGSANPYPKEIYTDFLLMFVFRVLCLWGVAQWWEERENDKPPSSLTTLLLANQGRVLYPQYSIIRCDKPPSSLTTLLLANQGRVLYPQYSIIRCDKPPPPSPPSSSPTKAGSSTLSIQLSGVMITLLFALSRQD
jgi:hypothetical protein